MYPDLWIDEDEDDMAEAAESVEDIEEEADSEAEAEDESLEAEEV
jgi:hypothetical protein